MSGLNYGKNTKRIVFTDTDHRHAQLLIRLNHDGLRQSDFFRSLITGYLEGDSRIGEFVAELGAHSEIRKRKSSSLKKAGKESESNLGLRESEIEDIFDIIKEEYPDL